jgi:glutaredoxin 3
MTRLAPGLVTVATMGAFSRWAARRGLGVMKPVRMYTTQVCPFCVRAKALLRQRGVAQIDEVRVDLDPVQRVRMMELTGRRTVPQIFIGDTHVGGCDELMALDQRGGLMLMLAETDGQAAI